MDEWSFVVVHYFAAFKVQLWFHITVSYAKMLHKKYEKKNEYGS